MKRLQKQIESYAGTNIAYLANGGTWLTLAKILGFITAFASSVVFANVLPEEVYGNYRFFLTLIALFSLTTLPGLNTATTRATALGDGGIFWHAKKMKIRWGIIGSLLSIATGLYYSFIIGNPTLLIPSIIIALFIPFLEPFNLYHYFLNGKKDFRSITIYTSTIRFFTTVFLIGIALLAPDAIWLIVGYLVITLLGRSIASSMTKPGGRPLSEKKAADHIQYGKRLSVLSLATEISVYLDKILVYTLLSPAMLAAYYLSFIPYKQTKNFLSSINTLAMPKFSANSAKTIRATLPKKMMKLYLIIIPLIILFWLVAKPIFSFIYPKYPESIFFAQLLMLQLAFYPFTLFTTSFSALKQTKRLYVTTISGALLRIIGILICIPIWGPVGAIVAILIARTMQAIIETIFFFYE